MAWEGLRDGSPKQHVLRAESRTDEDAEGVGATGSGAREPRRGDTPLLQIGDARQDCGTVRSRYDHTKSFLCHLMTSHCHACVISVTSEFRFDGVEIGMPSINSAYVMKPPESQVQPGPQAFRKTSREDSQSAAIGGWACHCATAHGSRRESAQI